MSLERILKTKTVSVWGLGYLGYTTMLHLQNNGFNILAYDLNQEQLNLFLKGKYPTQEQMISWSRIGYLPKLDLSRIKVATVASELFKESYLHIIAIPEDYRRAGEKSVAGRLGEIFSKHLKNSGIKPLVLFTSAFVPGHIENYFINPLKKEKINCSKEYYAGVAFRMDWSFENFIGRQYRIPIAGCCSRSSQLIRDLFSYLKVPIIELENFKEAEIYVNSMNTIQAMANDFVRQLALGYPNVNMKKLSRLLFKDIKFDDCDLNIGTGGTKLTFAINHLIEGSNNPGSLTLLKEFQDINISSVLDYAEYIIRNSYKSVAILGLTYKGGQKDLTLSPAITLAGYLIKNSVKVFVNDPILSKEEISKLIKGVRTVDFPAGALYADVLIITSDHKEYKYLSQESLEKLKSKTKLIIDNYGIWSHLSFSGKVRYHQIGDGTLNLLKR